MTEKEEILVNKLIAAGGWIRRAQDKQKVLAIAEAVYALTMAQQVIEASIKMLRIEKHERPKGSS
jgi:hypothetical protein